MSYLSCGSSDQFFVIFVQTWSRFIFAACATRRHVVQFVRLFLLDSFFVRCLLCFLRAIFMSILSFELVCLVEAGKTRFTTSFISFHFEAALPLLITPLFIFLLFSIRGNTVLCVTLFSSPSCNAILNLQLGPIFFFCLGCKSTINLQLGPIFFVSSCKSTHDLQLGSSFLLYDNLAREVQALSKR